jgi:hypothetical protein
MRSAKEELFTKSSACPSSTQLLWFSLHGAPTGGALDLISHLEVCDFCGAETHFLARHHPSYSPVASPEIPPHLRLLAESLLGKCRIVDCEKSE